MKADFRLVAAAIGTALALPLFFLQDAPLLFGTALLFMAAVTVAGYALKKISLHRSAVMWAAYLTLFSIAVYSIVPANAISQGAGTVLSNNWWEALNWIRENIPECATVATYWDPGHFIRAIAKRPVVFDGGSQNALLYIPYNGTKSGLEITSIDANTRQIINYDQKTKQEIHARIKDIAITLMTANESAALEILKNYKKPGCDEVYYLATSDLIAKSVWWTYFATWDPTREGAKGMQYSYFIASLARRKPIIPLNVIGNEYPVSGSQSIILCQANNSIIPCKPDQGIGAIFQDGNQFVRIERVLFPRGNSIVQINDRDAELKGTVLVLDPSGQIIVFIQPQLQDSMFTKMFFFNGAGLENFEFVGNWGGEVKLFRVRFDEGQETEPPPAPSQLQANVTDTSTTNASANSS